MPTESRFDDLDLREEPAGSNQERAGAPFTKVNCTQVTFGCTTTNAPLTGGCCE